MSLCGVDKGALFRFFPRGQNPTRAVPHELGFTRVRHYKAAEVG
jgi:hypothetical protein